MRHYVRGVVQGVGFRPFVYRIATEEGRRGFVRNNGSNVEICIDGGDERFLERLRSELPPLARIESVESEPLAPGECDAFERFEIKFSKEGKRLSPIPADTALCAPCRAEMHDPDDRRYHYAFTNCTDCGARFSVISDVPYDRPKTSMAPFEMCDACLAQYRDPLNRRFHAQTVSCPVCGPHYRLYDEHGAAIETDTDTDTNTDTDDPISRFARLVDDGAIGVVKAWGGMHIVATLEQVPVLRERYHRPAKPFAVMVRDLDAAGRYAALDDDAVALLTAPQAPITLVPKREGETAAMQAAVAPALDRIGLYLPHTGVQIRLFDALEHDALVMTSANLPGEPMTTENEDAFALEADLYLLHNRAIVNRCDDSVILPYRKNRYFLRKSRGYVPDPMTIPHDRSIVCVGPERNVVASFSRNGKLTLSQYIGNTRHYDVLAFLERAIGHLSTLFGLETLDAVGLDLHPRYATRRAARAIADEAGCRTIPVQHHFAHAASIMLEHQRFDPLVCLSLDGTGWGTDGTVWGGEVLLFSRHRHQRVASLGTFPLIGGDAAIRDPRRLVFAFEERLERARGPITDRFTPTEARVMARAMSKSVRTSSLGRVLDTLSCWLGVGCERTYDGEPAIRLERYLARGRARFEFKAPFVPDADGLPRVDLDALFAQLTAQLDALGFDPLASDAPTERQRADLAVSFVEPLIGTLTSAAILSAYEEGIGAVGLSGGVTYNIPICEMVRKRVERAGLELLLHDRLPNGDGGISAGQNLIVGWALDDGGG